MIVRAIVRVIVRVIVSVRRRVIRHVRARAAGPGGAGVLTDRKGNVYTGMFREGVKCGQGERPFTTYARLLESESKSPHAG